MKALVTIIALTLSVNTFANSIAGTSALSWYTTTSPSSWEKQAASEVLVAADEYHATGKMSLTLAQQVSGIQESQDISNSEAVDLLAERASEILN